MPDKELLGKENKNLLEILKTIQQYGMGALSQKEMKQFLDADIQGDLDKEIKEREELISGERDGEYLSGEERKAIVRKRRMSASKFFGREEKKIEADTTGTSSLAVRSKTGKIDKKKLIPEPTEEKGGALAEILTGVNSIIDTLKGQQKQDKKHQSWLQKLAERFKRRRKENKLEFKILDGIKNTATKLLKPFKSAWQRMLDFIGKVLLGRVLFKVLEWMGDKENQGKLKSIIKFFEDWWPVLLGGYLIFGNALTGFALGLLKNVVVWGAKLVATVIPMLLKAALAMGPWGLAAAAVLGGGIYLATRGKKDEESPDQEMEDDDVTTERTSDSFTTRGGPEADQLQNQMAESRGEETQGFNQGGLVQHYDNATQQASSIIQGFNEGGYASKFEDADYVQKKMAQRDQAISDSTNAAAGRELDPLVNFAMDQMKEMYGITNTKAGAVDDGAGGFRMQSQQELNEENNAKLPFGMKMTEDGQNIDLGRRVADTARMAAELMKDPKYAGRLKEVGKQFGFDNLTPKQFGEIANQQADDLQFSINRMIPGTESYRLDVAANEINQNTSKMKMVSGGVVKGPGGVDKVPARLTAGEFVMSKGAVQKYGVNTLAAMNSAGGGTNIPTLMGGKPAYEGGGLVTVKPGTINSYQDAIDAGIEVEDMVVGDMRFGSIRWKEKLPKGWFGKQKYEIKGTKWNISSVGGGADKDLAMSTKDFVNTRMGWSKASSAKVEPVKSKSDISKQSTSDTFRGQGNKIRKRVVPSKSGDPNIQPPEKKKVTVAYEEEKDKMSDKPNMDKPGKEIPQFDVTKGRSSKKIKVLGISV